MQSLLGWIDVDSSIDRRARASPTPKTKLNLTHGYYPGGIYSFGSPFSVYVYTPYYKQKGVNHPGIGQGTKSGMMWV